jgi:cell wall-associated NlpC family hydrolase
MAVATLFIASPGASAATAAPTQSSPATTAVEALSPALGTVTDLAPALIRAASAPIAGIPATLLTPSVDAAIHDALIPPTLLLTGASTLVTPPTASTVTMSAAARVIADAKIHLGAPYVHGATGPRVFDCIGLVLRAYSDAGLLSKLGGWANDSGYTLYNWARRHHLTSTTHGEPGDVAVWGGGAHVGIYLGNGMAISALVSGVRIAGIHALTNHFTAFIHTGLSTVQVKAVANSAQTAKSIGVRHAGPSLALRSGHDPSDRLLATLKAGTKLTLLTIWHDPRGRVWYRVNANEHVGWVAGWLTRT